MTCHLPLQEKGDPVIACQVNNDKNFAFLEFRSTEEATKVRMWDAKPMIWKCCFDNEHMI